MADAARERVLPYLLDRLTNDAQTRPEPLDPAWTPDRLAAYLDEKSVGVTAELRKLLPEILAAAAHARLTPAEVAAALLVLARSVGKSEAAFAAFRDMMLRLKNAGDRGIWLSGSFEQRLDQLGAALAAQDPAARNETLKAIFGEDAAPYAGTLVDRAKELSQAVRKNTEVPALRTWSLRQAHQAVIRDLSWLLNASRRPAFDSLEEFPELSKSVMNYGMPDLCGLTASGISPEQLERVLVQVIQRYEPRVLRNTLSVRLIPGDGSGHANSVVLEIKCEIWAQPVPDALYIRTEVDLESGQCEMVDRQGG